jgi:chromosome segregation ATPase
MKTIQYMIGYYEGVSGDVVTLDTSAWTSEQNLQHIAGRWEGLNTIEDYETEAKGNAGTVTELECTIEGLQEELSMREGQIDALECRVSQLEDEIDDLNDTLDSIKAMDEREKYQ